MIILKRENKWQYFVFLFVVLILFGCQRPEEAVVNEEGLFVDGSEKVAFYLRVETLNFRVDAGIDDANQLIKFVVYPRDTSDVYVISTFAPIQLNTPQLFAVGETVYFDDLHSNVNRENETKVLVDDEILVVSLGDDSMRKYRLIEFLNSN